MYKAELKSRKEFDVEAHLWVTTVAPRHQSCKAFFCERLKCDTIVNNLCESFNSKILDAREQPIISMMETIRVYLMRIIQQRVDWIRKSPLSITPVIKEVVDERIKFSRGWSPISNGARGYEVKGPGGAQYVVYLKNKTCSCRLWQLSGIPCNHAMACIHRSKGSVLEHVDECFS